MRYLLTIATILVLLTQTNLGYAQAGQGINAVQALALYQQRADKAFDSERYDRARREYRELAKLGDKYAQYRLAVIYEQGLGVPIDLIEAYAWSYVATESERSEYKEYHRSIRGQLNGRQLEAARELAGDRIGELGTYTVAINARKEIRQQKSECVGSRIGSSCERVSTIGTRPGSFGFSCNGFNGSIPSRSCLMLGAIGLPSVIGQQPSDIRKIERVLNQFIRSYDPGRIELGDLELIDS